MLFATHLAAAALAGRQTRLPVLWLLVGATLPDAVDKPLAMLGVVDLFHTIGHTALLAVVLVPVALRGQRWVALVVGWGSHLFLDAAHIALNGRYGDLAFLVWPLVRQPDPLAIPPGSFFFYYLWTPSFFVEVAFWAVLLALVVRGGRPWHQQFLGRTR